MPPNSDRLTVPYLVAEPAAAIPTSEARKESFRPPAGTSKIIVKRSVQFANRTRIYLIPSINDMSEEAKSEIWGTDEQDKEEAEEDIVKTIRAMRSGKKTEEDDRFCSRGLEHMQSAAHMEQRRINKDCAFDAVLDEQDRQWSAGHSDDDADAIANASASASQWAREKALQMGASDEAYVRRNVWAREHAS